MPLVVWTEDDYVAMPWRNGLGTTTELAREGADQKFLWRISRADVAADGAFSNFSGIDRILVLLSGGGLKLAFADREVTLDTPYQSAEFGGDEPVHCTLLNGPCRDFNIMVDRARARAEIFFSRAPMSGHAAWRTLLHVLDGDWVLQFEDAKTPLPEDSLVLLQDQAGQEFSVFGHGLLLRIDIARRPA